MFRGQYVRTSAHTFCKCHVSQYIMHYTSPNRRISQRIPACPGNSESWHLLFEHTEQGGQVDLPTCPPPGGGTGAAGRRVCGFSQGSRRRLRGAGRRPAKFFLAFFARRRRENFLWIQVSPPKMSALFTCTNTPSTWIVHTPMSSCMCGPPPPTSAPLHAMRCDGRCNRKPIGST